MLRPLYQRIKVDPDTPPDRTKSGILLVDRAMKEKRVTGIVVGVGAGADFLKIGDRIMYGEYAGFIRFEDENGDEDELHGKPFNYMNEGDAIAIYDVA